MSIVHFLNVNPGDCSIIQHGSGRVSVIDVCDGHTDEMLNLKRYKETQGNFLRADYPTNPIEYLKRQKVKDIWRFICTHPDMDHLDGFQPLASAFPIANFWDTGVRREKPSFEGSPYHQEDWDYFVKVRDKKTATNSEIRLAGDLFPFANKEPEGGGGVDGLHVLAPNKALVQQAMETGDMNDASYVILYRTSGGRILFTGDAHDDTFEHVLKHYKADVSKISVMIAPHHGRKSDREYDFLDVVQPGITLFGYAPSEHLAYDAYRSRHLMILTSNQAGDMVLHCDNGRIDVYVENPYCERVDVNKRNAQGYYLRGSISWP